MVFFLVLLLNLSAFGQEAPLPFTDINSVQALRNIELLAGKSPQKLSEPELEEWVRARFAWIALLRLEGKTKEAIDVFNGCDRYCAKHGALAEWKTLKAWGCAKNKLASACK